MVETAEGVFLSAVEEDGFDVPKRDARAVSLITDFGFGAEVVVDRRIGAIVSMGRNEVERKKLDDSIYVAPLASKNCSNDRH